MKMDEYLSKLPNDILIYIFQYLSLDELLVIDNLSERYRGLVYERRLVKTLRFRRCFNVTGTTLKNFLSVDSRKLNVKTIELDGCSWLKSDDFSPLKDLKNLTSLNLTRCDISATLFIEIIKNLQLYSLSFTWTDELAAKFAENTGNIELKTGFNKLRVAKIEIPSRSQFYDLYKFSYYCLMLYHLTLREMLRQNLRILECLDPPPAIEEPENPRPIVKLPHLRDFKVLLRTDIDQKLYAFISEILVGTLLVSGRLKSFWISTGGAYILSRMDGVNPNVDADPILERMKDAKYLSLSFTSRWKVYQGYEYDDIDQQLVSVLTILTSGLANCTHLSLDTCELTNEMLTMVAEKSPKLKHLCLHDSDDTGCRDVSNGFRALGQKCLHLTELSLIQAHFYANYNPCEAIAQIKGLRKLSISSCILLRHIENPNANHEDEFIIDENELPAIEPRLVPITRNCVDLRVLIIGGAKTSSKCDKNARFLTDNDLRCIANLTRLEVLKLKHLTSVQGSFLPDVCKSNPLQVLSLIYVGVDNEFDTAALQEAFNYCTNLLEFKIQATRGLIVPEILASDSLLKCQKLETLYLHYSDDGLNNADIVNVIKKLPRLVNFVLVLIALENYEEVREQLAKDIDEAMKESRPAFKTLITNNYYHPDVRSMYKKHFRYWNEIA